MIKSTATEDYERVMSHTYHYGDTISIRGFSEGHCFTRKEIKAQWKALLDSTPRCQKVYDGIRCTGLVRTKEHIKTKKGSKPVGAGDAVSTCDKCGDWKEIWK